MYSAKVLEQFQNMKYVGELPDADAYVQVDNPACGDILKLSIKVKDGRVTDVRFRARGCVAAIACAAQMADIITYMPVAEVRNVSSEEIVQELGGLPVTSVHASQLAIEALRRALKQLPA